MQSQCKPIAERPFSSTMAPPALPINLSLPFFMHSNKVTVKVVFSGFEFAPLINFALMRPLKSSGVALSIFFFNAARSF